MQLIGRRRERAVFDQASQSDKAELIAVYGRRRIGKTVLIREYFASSIVFELTGLSNAPLDLQLENFSAALERAFGSSGSYAAPSNWFEAFQQLEKSLQGHKKGKRRRVVFFDELPWLATRRSGFLGAFEHFWNSWASKQNELIVVVCGSAASWMINRVVESRTGLHNRVTRRVRLMPFSVGESQALLENHGVKLTEHQVLEIYMALGGVPYYLEQVQRGESAAQAIDRLCFAHDGALRAEFQHLYAALFERADRHENVVRVLAGKPGGMARNELLAKTGLRSGGGTTTLLSELIECGFIQCLPQWGMASKEALYRLSDEYSLFYLRWVEGKRALSSGAWLKRRGTPAWRAWSGLAFEAMCLKHVDALKMGLGISGVETEESGWHVRSTNAHSGAQVDLVIDRKDNCINLCEMKFVDGPFVINKRYAEVLRRKLAAFRESTGTKKALFLTFVTTYGVTSNAHSRELVAAQLLASILFTT